MVRLSVVHTSILICVVLVSFFSVMAGTAPQLAVGRFAGCNYKSFTDITNRLGQQCQIFGQLHRGAGLNPRIPIEITAARDGEAFLLKGGQTGISNTFTANIPADGTVRFNFVRPSGAQGFTTNALTIFAQCPSGLFYQAGYEIDCPSFDDSFTYPYSLDKLIPLGSCAMAPIHPQQNTPAVAIVGPPNDPIDATVRSTIRGPNGNVLDVDTFSTNGEHRARTLWEVNTGLDPTQVPLSATWEICPLPNLGRAGGIAAVFHEINSGGLLSVADHQVGPANDKCNSNQNTLCLGPAGRFRTQLRTRNSENDPLQLAQGTQFDDYGVFFFFDPDNIEMVVKVLDACDLEGFNSFWVFAAGLTDVEVTLTVTDTQTGSSKEYFNPLNTAFQPIQDTSAFATCP